MAIGDSVVLGQDFDRHEDMSDAFAAFMARRSKRCRYIVNASMAVSRSQLDVAPIDYSQATIDMIRVTAQPL